MKERYCPACGVPVEPERAFCAECGEQLDARGGIHATPPRQTSQDTTMAALTHVLALLTWIVGPLVVLLATDDHFVKENARNALNWQIMFTIYVILSVLLMFVLVGFLFIMILPILDLAFCIIAAVKASEGEAWRYPLTPDIV